jgi:hypothetical protein
MWIGNIGIETSFRKSSVSLRFLAFSARILSSSTSVLRAFPTSSLLVLARKRERDKKMNVSAAACLATRSV